MLRKSLGWKLGRSWTLALALAMAALMPSATLAATFGRVVPIGGAASDLVLDEARGVLYVANFTANRIEVMSLATNTVRTSINVASQPSSISLSPDGHWLLVTHYGNRATPASPSNAMTLVDLNNNNAKQTFALGNPPLGAAFGIDNKALVVTTTDFILFDPALGTTQLLESIKAQAAKVIPQPNDGSSFPPNIVAASAAASADGLTIFGFGDNLIFRYSVASKGISSTLYSSAPPLGPRAIAVSDDGSYAALGWTMVNSSNQFFAEFPSPSGKLNVGGHAIDSRRALVYSQVPKKDGELPVLSIRDADNLTLREQLQLPENLAGKAVISADGATVFAVSDSGVTVLPVGNLNRAPRLAASVEDLVFRGDFCDRNTATKTFVLVDPGGNNVPFSISSSSAGIRVSPSSGVTPAVITVRVDPNAYSNQRGTSTVLLGLASSAAVNIAPPIRVLVNSREPDQRGTFSNIPGNLVDVLAHPTKNEFYVLRQDRNQVLVYDGANNTLKTTLRTCTKPMSMAITQDRRNLLVGCDNSHIISVFDTETLQAQLPIYRGDSYVQSLAASNRGILAVMRDGGGGSPNVQFVDLAGRTTTKPDSLGVFENKVDINSVLTVSPNGATVLLASATGNVMLYDANVDSFTVSRKDFTALEGSYAASAFGQYQIGNRILNSSLVQVGQALESTSGRSSGFAFLDNTAIRTSAPDSTSAGVIQRVDLTTGNGIRPTRMVEAPVLKAVSSALGAGQSICTTTTHDSTITTQCQVGSLVTTDICTTTVANGVSTRACASTSDNVGLGDKNPFTRSLIVLQDRSALISMTTSGFTVLPWAYDASVAPPRIARLVSAADGVSGPAPGGLISLYGSQLSPTNLATNEIPIPTALGDSCLTVNGQPMPMIFVSPSQINAQMPFQSVGNVTVVVHTPGGVSDNYNLTIQPTAPSVFQSQVVGLDGTVPTVLRASNSLLVTPSNPVHRDDTLVIYLTGLGQVSPVVDTGLPAPSDPLASALTRPTVKLGGVDLTVEYAGLAPGEVGVYQINVHVPNNVPQGLSVPLTISQGGPSQSYNMRVVQ